MFFLYGCVEPFDAPTRDIEVGFLVVDGYVNTSTHAVTVKLSRAIPLNNTGVSPVENGALITLEEIDGRKFSLTAVGEGQYQFSSPEIVNGKQYRLNIITGKETLYQSGFITTKESPPIDSLTWDPEDEGINVRVNTHDDSGNTEYYRWDFTETWEYNSPYFSSLIVKDGSVIPRPSDQPIYVCYRSENATEIVTANTSALTQNKISGLELAYIPKYSQKYSRHYSIRVRQFSLSKEGFEYWQQLKNTSENLGGLFDPQPSRVKGNIRKVNSDELVIGYFDGGSVSEKRIFFKLQDLPDSFKKFPRTSCEELEIGLAAARTLPEFYLITSTKVVDGFVVGYYYTVTACADCRAQGGSTTKPDFWPN